MAIEESKKIENGSREIKTRGRRILDECYRVMSAHAKEICFVITVFFTVYAALHSGPVKTQKVAVPIRFFPSDSLVTDYYLGSIYNAFERISESDLTFVMYYATWDATSMVARWEFDKIANYFHNEIQFLAINCWWPEGDCRQHFRKIQSYPVLMAYPGIGRGIQYRGPVVAAYMFAFLEKLRNPLQRILSLGDLIDLQVIHDTVVVAYFDFEFDRQPAGFDAYYNTAMKALERDPSQKVCFAVATEKKVASLLGLANTKDVVLFHFNQSLVYDRTVVKEKVLSWTYKERKPVVNWLNLPMTKSLQLSNVLEKSSPALILFTPQNPVVDINLYFNLLKEVAMDYYDCNSTSSVRQLIAHSTNIGSYHRSNMDQTSAD
uniref:Thioredoxin domain-containing protein n=1 Tax=Strigamia maritima TaxID=126957 RepID=T1IKJ1_STRMM